MSKREFLKLAHDYKPERHKCSGMYMSEKLDGQRCFWDGGVTRGLYCHDIPFANVAKDTKERVATGLWSRYCKPVIAPDWWLNALPALPLDGELYTGRQDRQNCRSIVSRHEPDNRWKQVKYRVFGSPPLRTVFKDGVIDSPHFRKSLYGVLDWLDQAYYTSLEPTSTFDSVYKKLLKEMPVNDVVNLEPQWRLPLNEKSARSELEVFLNKITDSGGEGVILQSPFVLWTPERSWNTLKVKKWQDAEGKIVSYVWGKEGKEGKLLGLMGSVVVEWKGKKFNLSGFNESDRCMVTVDGLPAMAIGMDNPGEPVIPGIYNPLFRVGEKITFRYRSLTDDGIPTEAKYWRKP